jgi:hypothetical protein
MNAQAHTIFPSKIEYTPRFRGEGTVEPVGISGHCLDPWLSEGDVVAIDRELEPQDGDLVIVSLRYRKSLGFIGSAAPTVRRDSMKQLRIVDGQSWLACADGWIEWPREGRLVGVVTAWHRVGDDRPAMSTMSFDEFRE